jgi:2-methylcitrate dehydratase PrpD
MRYVLSYAIQQVSGVWSWERDVEHVEKAFDFAGMGARNGVTAALMVQLGFTGVEDVLEGEHNALEAHSREPKPEEMARDLGTRYFVTETAIKTFSVGYPIQAALDAFLSLRREHAMTPATVERIVATLPEDGARIVDNRSMPDVNLQYLIAVALVDGTVSFDASHSYERMKDPQVLDVKRRVELVADRALMDPAAPRSARVEVRLRDGRTVNRFTRHAPGTKENPLDAAGVNAKAKSLMEPVIGARRTAAVIERVHGLEAVGDVRELMALLRT